MIHTYKTSQVTDELRASDKDILLIQIFLTDVNFLYNRAAF